MSRVRRWSLLVVVGIALLLITLENSILYTALPTLTKVLGASDAQALWIVSVYPLVMAGLLMGSGTLGDRIGHSRMFVAGLLIFGSSSLLGAFALAPEMIVAARAVLAVGAAAMLPATLALIRGSFDDVRERNVAFGMWGSLAVVGGALRPVVGGLLLQTSWWGAIFLIKLPFVLLALIGIATIRPTDSPNRSKRWDYISSGQALIALVAAVVAIQEFAHVPPSTIVILTAGAVAAVAAFAFVRRQRRMVDPLVDFEVFRSRPLTAGMLSGGFALFAMAGTQLVTAQRFQQVEALTPFESGSLLAALALGSLPTSVLGGVLLDRLGLRIIMFSGFALATGGLLLMTIGASASALALIAGLVLTGAGLGAPMSVTASAILGNIASHRAGMAASLKQVSYEFGSLTAVATLGSLLSLIVSLSNSLNAAYTLTLMCIACVTAIAAVTTGALLRGQRPTAARVSHAHR